MISCCAEFAGAATRQFTNRIATRDLDRYRGKGPAATTRLLRDGLAQVGRLVGSLLDIGAGIGALTFEMLDAGVTNAIAVDASAAYVDAASREATRRGRADAIRFVCADFLGIAAQIPPAAIVALDRVMCCYPAYEPLLDEALRHAERHFAFSYPRDVWYVHAGNAVMNGKRRFTGNSFRTFVHSAAQMKRIITESGFALVHRRRTWNWSVDIYARGRRP